MRRSRLVFVAGAVALSLMGCATDAASPRSADAERALLAQRVLALQAQVAEAGRMTAAQQQELESIAQDIETWRERTGRDDLSVSRPGGDSRFSTREVVQAAAQSSCAPCPPVKTINGSICFLNGEGNCPPPGSIISRVCWYTCIYIGPVPPSR